MNRKDVYFGIAILVVAILGGMFLHAIVSDRLAKQHYEDIKTQVAENIQSIRADLKATNEKIDKDHDARKTPVQIAQGVPTYFPGVHPQVILAGGGPQTSGSPVTGSIPADGSLVIPPEEVKPFWDNIALCAKSANNLTACSKENLELRKQIDTAEETIKGGKWYKRVWRVTKPVLCSAGGAGIAAVAGAKPGTITAVGAGSGAACAIF